MLCAILYIWARVEINSREFVSAYTCQQFFDRLNVAK